MKSISYARKWLYGLLLGLSLTGLQGCALWEQIRCLTHKKKEVHSRPVVHYRCLPHVEVLHRPSNEELVAAEIIFAGGVQQYDTTLAGIEALALETVIQGGTYNYTRKLFRKRLDAFGVKLDVNVGLDYASIRFQCLREHFTDAQELIFDALIYPSFPLKTFLEVRDRLAREVKSREEEPLYRLQQLANAHAFETHPYRIHPEGSYERLVRLDRDTVAAFYNDFIENNKLKMAVVGNLPTDSIGYPLKALPLRGARTTKTPGHIHLSGTSAQIAEDQDLPISFIEGRFSGPPPKSREALILQFGMALLTERLKLNLCERRYLTCNIRAYYTLHQAGYGVIQYAAQHPKPTILAVNQVLRDVTERGFRKEEIASLREKFLLNYFLTIHTQAGQAQFLGRSLVQGNWNLMLDYPHLIRTVTQEEIHEITAQAIRHIAWNYLGKPDEISSFVFKL